MRHLSQTVSHSDLWLHYCEAPVPDNRNTCRQTCSPLHFPEELRPSRPKDLSTLHYTNEQPRDLFADLYTYTLQNSRQPAYLLCLRIYDLRDPKLQNVTVLSTLLAYCCGSFQSINHPLETKGLFKPIVYEFFAGSGAFRFVCF